MGRDFSNIKHQLPLKVGVQVGLVKGRFFETCNKLKDRILTQPPCPARRRISLNRLWSFLTVKIPTPRGDII